MPRKTGVIILMVCLLTVFIASSRINGGYVSNKNKQKIKMTKGNSDTNIKPEPILEVQNFVDMENENNKPSTEKINQKSKIQDEIMGYRLKSKARTRQTQNALKKSGFYKGDIDGKMGPQTKKAIKAFQKSKGLNPDGVVGVKTWEELAKILKK